MAEDGFRDAGYKYVSIDVSTFYHCAVPEYIHTHPMEDYWGWEGSQKPKTLKGISGGVGGFKTLLWKGYGYFLNNSRHVFSAVWLSPHNYTVM